MNQLLIIGSSDSVYIRYSNKSREIKKSAFYKYKPISLLFLICLFENNLYNWIRIGDKLNIRYKG